jgi:hypothetical protein
MASFPFYKMFTQSFHFEFAGTLEVKLHKLSDIMRQLRFSLQAEHPTIISPQKRCRFPGHGIFQHVLRNFRLGLQGALYHQPGRFDRTRHCDEEAWHKVTAISLHRQIVWIQTLSLQVAEQFVVGGNFVVEQLGKKSEQMVEVPLSRLEGLTRQNASHTLNAAQQSCID